MATTIIVKQQVLDLERAKRLAAQGGAYVVVDLTSFEDKAVSADGYVFNKETLFEHGIIKKNAIKCNKCGDIIESLCTEHHISCDCGICAIDGGRTRLDRSSITGINQYTELSEFIAPVLNSETYNVLLHYYTNL